MKCEVQAQLLTCSRPDSQILNWQKPLREKGEKQRHERKRGKNDNNDSGEGI